MARSAGLIGYLGILKVQHGVQVYSSALARLIVHSSDLRDVVQPEILRIEVRDPFPLSRLLVDSGSRSLPYDLLGRIDVTTRQSGRLCDAQLSIVVEVLIDGVVLVRLLFGRLVEDVGLRLGAALASRPALVHTVDMLAVDLDECLFLVSFLFAASRGLWSLRHLLDDQLIVVELDQIGGLTTTAGC